MGLSAYDLAHNLLIHNPFGIINSVKKQISVPTTYTTRRKLLESQILRNVLTCHLTRTPSRIKISTHRHYKHLSNLTFVLLPFLFTVAS